MIPLAGEKNLAPLRRKTARVAGALERFLGVPRPPARKAKPIDMLIATLLSQNTNDKNSHRAYVNLRRTFPRWEDVLNASERTLRAVIRSAGMANQKSARMKEILRTIKRRYGRLTLESLRREPDEKVFEELLSLKGVGVKTAACVLVFSLGRDVFPVDTHIHRICGRLGLAPDCRSPEKTFDRMKDIVPRRRAYSLHTNLIRFGRTVCRSNRPRCSVCPVYGECVFEKKAHYRALGVSHQSKADHSFMVLDNVAC